MAAHETLLAGLALVSLFTFVVTLLVIPILILYIPENYFLHRRRKAARKNLPFPGWRLLLILFKNFLGILFVLAGMAMLVLPGQGLLTILIGLMCLDFPGKYKLEQRIVRQPRVRTSINWIRARAKRPPVRV